MDAFFTAIAIPLECVGFFDLGLETLQLRCHQLALFANLVLGLLCVADALFKQLGLLACTVCLGLSEVQTFQRVLVRFCKGHEPVADLLQKSVRLAKLLFQVLGGPWPSLGTVILCLSWDPHW